MFWKIKRYFGLAVMLLCLCAGLMLWNQRASISLSTWYQLAAFAGGGFVVGASIMWIPIVILIVIGAVLLGKTSIFVSISTALSAALTSGVWSHIAVLFKATGSTSLVLCAAAALVGFAIGSQIQRVGMIALVIAAISIIGISSAGKYWQSIASLIPGSAAKTEAVQTVQTVHKKPSKQIPSPAPDKTDEFTQD